VGTAGISCNVFLDLRMVRRCILSLVALWLDGWMVDTLDMAAPSRKFMTYSSLTATHHASPSISYYLTSSHYSNYRTHGQRGADVDTLRGTSGANYEGEAKVKRGGSNNGFCGCFAGSGDEEPVRTFGRARIMSRPGLLPLVA
jgi:hypothetical protein